jgi:hypothetical protein
MKMLTHMDYDDGTAWTDPEVTLPAQIDSIRVSHDGGRLSIGVNGVELFYSSIGTRDCSIEIVRSDAQ